MFPKSTHVHIRKSPTLDFGTCVKSFSSNIQLAITRSIYFISIRSPSVFLQCGAGDLKDNSTVARVAGSANIQAWLLKFIVVNIDVTQDCRFEILIKINSDAFQALVSKTRSFSTFQKAPTPNQVYENELPGGDFINSFFSQKGREISKKY